MRLLATRSVLYRSTQYRAGDALPADNKAMVEAWLDAKSAKWEDETAKAPKSKKPEAKKPAKKPAVKKPARKETK